MTTTPDPAALAQQYLNGEKVPVESLLGLPAQLSKSRTFGLGLRVFEKLRLDQDPTVRRAYQDRRAEVAQKAALCAYKDPDVPARDGLDRAQEILELECGLAQSDDPETLGLAGAVFKRKWERTGRPVELGRSLQHYRRSFMGQPPEDADDAQREEIQRSRIGADQGYNAINAAFMADVFAGMLEVSGERRGAAEHRQEADRVRRLILEVLAEESTSFWYVATQLEAAFGLGEFDGADDIVTRLRGLKEFSSPELKAKNSWMRQSTATQLAKIVRLRFPEDRRPREVLRGLLGEGVSLAAVESLVLGKVGMALSGGGFRSAFFHIGVLARLAELDVLRFVEVLSTVSGGSILGAHYYLLLKRRLEAKGQLDREDYIGVVRTMETEFLKGVQTDVRSTMYRDLPQGLAALLHPGKVVGGALGKMFEELFYRPFFEGEAGDRIYMDQLAISPADDPDFHPRNDNWSRRSKVPMLFLNATSLNTGHVWQFTSSYAGESPYAIDTSVDSNERLRRFYYSARDKKGNWLPPIKARRVPLGTAVAASACVPGLFPPVDLGERYPDYRVRLVDGGVHDNQGVITLLEQDCTQLIVSDACGQMTTERAPGGVAIGPVLRTNSILMERVRQEEHERVDALRDSSRLSGFLFIHLRQDLAGDAVDWHDCETPLKRAERGELLSYGIRRDYQEALAAMRTDLDAFSEVEAAALMFSGYRMAERAFDKALPDLARVASKEPPHAGWKFLGVADLMTEHPVSDARQDRFRELLEESSKQLFRDTVEEEEQVMEKLAAIATRVKWGAAGLGLVALLLPLGIWLRFGLVPGLWTGLTVLGAVLVALGILAAVAIRKLDRAREIAELGPWRESLPLMGYAGVLWAAKRFCTFHMKHYKDKLLAKATLASLNRMGAR